MIARQQCDNPSTSLLPFLCELFEEGVGEGRRKEGPPPPYPHPHSWEDHAGQTEVRPANCRGTNRENNHTKHKQTFFWVGGRGGGRGQTNVNQNSLQLCKAVEYIV